MSYHESAGDHEYTCPPNWAVGKLGTVAVRGQRVVDWPVETLAMLAEHSGETMSQACGGRG